MSATAVVAGVEVSPDHFIGGERVSSAATFPDISPIDESHLADIARGGGAEIPAARPSFGGSVAEVMGSDTGPIASTDARNL